MTKKHFIALADDISYHNQALNTPAREHFTKLQIEVLAKFCKRQNYRFNEARWLSYIAGECGPNGGAIRKERAA